MNTAQYEKAGPLLQEIAYCKNVLSMMAPEDESIELAFYLQVRWANVDPVNEQSHIAVPFPAVTEVIRYYKKRLSTAEAEFRAL